MKKLVVAVAGAASLAAAFSFVSTTEAEAQMKAAKATPVRLANACVYAAVIPFCPAVVMDAAGNRYDVSGVVRRPANANPVNIVGAYRDTSWCGRKVVGIGVQAKGVCHFGLRPF